MTTIIPRTVVFSDLHSGSTVGLWPGKHRVEGGGTYEGNKFQVWLLECWKAALEEVSHMTPPPIVVLNGDELQGVNMRDGQLITNKIDIQQDAAFTLLKPLRDMACKMYVVRGTEWHVGKAAENIEALAKQLEAVPDPTSGQYSWWELYLDMGGSVVHFAHHIQGSSVPWYEATVPLRDTLMLLAELDRFFASAAPNVRTMVRSHRHRYIHVEAPPNVKAVVTPAWQLKTAFAYKKATVMLPQIGYVVIENVNGELVPHKRIFDLPPLHIERVEGVDDGNDKSPPAEADIHVERTADLFEESAGWAGC